MSANPTTARLSRLAGALLLAGNGFYFLIGNTKEPCDWATIGFEQPAEGDAATLRVRRLIPTADEPSLGPAALSVLINGQPVETIAERLADRLLIRRNASFSERLWRIVTGASDEHPTALPAEADVTWLIAMPERVWEIVRDTALKCL
jgi:hypothetical protein